MSSIRLLQHIAVALLSTAASTPRLCVGQVATDMMRATGRPSLEALKATVELEWQQLKDIRRRITPAVTAPSVRVF